jgi:hypothetical protein
VLGRERVEREQVGLGGFEQLGDLGRGAGEPVDDLGELLAGLVGVLGAEYAADRGGDHRLLRAGDVAEHVSEEVNGAALPGAAEDLSDRGLQSGVGV